MKNHNIRAVAGFFLLALLSQGIVPMRNYSRIEYEPSPAIQGDNNLGSWVWLPPELITTESTGISIIDDAHIDQSGNIHVVWSDDTNYQSAGDDMDIFYKKWDANSRSWTVTEVVTTESTSYILNGFPSIRVDSQENVHITWEDTTDYADSGADTDIFYKCYNASLEFWMDIEVVTFESNTSITQYHDLEIDDEDTLHMVWKDALNIASEGTDGDIYYKYRNATTGDWSDAEVVSLQSTMFASQPKIVIDKENTIHVVWLDVTDTDGDALSDVFYSYKNGSTWTVDSLISTATTLGAISPAIACDPNNNIHVAWSDSTDYSGAESDYDIFYTRFDSTSKLWLPTVIVSTESSYDANTPSLECDEDGIVHFVWQDGTNYHNAGVNSDIFYKNYDPSANEWTETEVISPYSTDTSVGKPLILSDQNGIHCLWYDNTPIYDSGDDTDIYYYKFTGTPSSPTLIPINPSPTRKTEISLDWDDCVRTLSYYIYRSSNVFATPEDLTPIGLTIESSFVDELPGDGIYYYAVVAGNYDLNSTMSNLEDVEVDNFHLNFELKDLIILLVGVVVVLVVNGIVISWINAKKTKKLLVKYATLADMDPNLDKIAKTEKKLKAIEEILKEK